MAANESAAMIQKRESKISCFREGYAVTTDDEIERVTFVNATAAHLRYKVSNKPTVFYLESRWSEHCDEESELDGKGQSEDTSNGVDTVKRFGGPHGDSRHFVSIHQSLCFWSHRSHRRGDHGLWP